MSYKRLLGIAAVSAALVVSGCGRGKAPAAEAGGSTNYDRVTAREAEGADVDPPSDSVTDADAAAGDVAEKTFMVEEAELPAGFPPPGPVGEVVLKEYPAYRAAVVRSEDLDGAGQDGMFMPLFNHITDKGIAMTAPVEMTYPPDGSEVPAGGAGGAAADGEGDATPADEPVSMAFIYGDPGEGAPGRDGVVRVEDFPAQHFVSVAVRGSYDGENFRAAVAQIRQWLKGKGDQYEAVGPPRYLGYNSPFVLGFMRVGEVQVPVRVNGTGTETGNH